jgi:hypothetical protein
MIRTQSARGIRGDPRRPFDGAVLVSWQTSTGEMKTIQGKCVDISDQGARIECEAPIDLRTTVYLRAAGYGVMGNASVRFCRRDGTKHIVGLLFSSVASQAEQGRKNLIQSRPHAEK